MNVASMNILVIEDDEDTRENLRDILELDDHHIDTVGSAAEAMARHHWDRLDAIILDRLLPDAIAEHLMPRLKAVAPEAAIILVTGYSDLQGAIAALRQGASDYLLKPLNPDLLRASLARIAERQRLKQAKERSETTFRHLVEASDCMTVILRPDHSIVYFSPFAEQLTGYTLDTIRGRDFAKLFLPETTREVVTREWARVVAGSPSGGFENPVVCRDGSLRSIVWNARYLSDYEDGPAILKVGHDITFLKQAQERAVQSERLAAIGEMVAGLAHESRNALQRSQACLEMLALIVHDRPEALNLIERIQNAQDHLHTLYEDVRGYAAPIKLERTPCDLGRIWREAWGHLETDRNGRQAVLRESLDGIDLRCNADAFRVQQVFRNILDNAMAAAPSPVTIEVRAESVKLQNRPAVRVSFHDNGPGIPADQRARVFDPFFTTKARGTGLGLPIARRIIEAHGGQMAIGDGDEPGATLIVTLPKGNP